MNYTNVIQEKLNKISKLEIEVIELNNQIELSKSLARNKGQFADRTWFRNINYELRLKQQQLTAENRELNELRRLMKSEKKDDRLEQQTTFERCFVDVAKERMKPEVFEKMVYLTQKLQKERELEKIKIQYK